jgi:hypothetical protein
MIYVLAAGLLLIAVVLLVLRPLFPSSARVVAAGERRHATQAAHGGLTPHVRDDAGTGPPSDADALELVIAERRARMAEREEGGR